MEENEMKTIDERLARIESLVLIGAKEVLTIDECAMFTGYSRNYIYRLTSQRAIPCYKPGGGKICFRKSEIERWMLSNRQATATELSRVASTIVAKKNLQSLKTKGI
jgi:excisionase family DNA binding protein